MDSPTTQSRSAASSQYGVRTEVWINWSRGRVLGATLTVSNSNGALAIDFTAFFISLVASRFWRIVCLVSTGITQQIDHGIPYIISANSRETATLNYTRYHYGNRAPTGVPPIEIDYTLEVEDLASQYIEGYRPSSSQLTLSSLVSATFNGTNDLSASDWNASMDLSRTDGDTIITFLSGNGVLALESISDPWYQQNRTCPK
ncbi:putative Carboxylic ester hydrolase [Seiridium cardinale]|uniref:Carboxylic ester hydrolase n=1 Tax=Seiridium cardinale TaxID=138064 RepID=A0ABR2XJG4_9PEZI